MEKEALKAAVERGLGRSPSAEEIDRAEVFAGGVRLWAHQLNQVLDGEAVIRLVGGVAYVGPGTRASTSSTESTVWQRLAQAVAAGWALTPAIDHSAEDIAHAADKLEEILELNILLHEALQGHLGIDPTAFRPRFIGPEGNVTGRGGGGAA